MKSSVDKTMTIKISIFYFCAEEYFRVKWR